MKPEVFWRNVRQKAPFIRSADIAKIVGTSTPIVSRWIKTNSLPKVEQIVMLATALGTTVNELVYEKEEVKA